MIRDEEVNPRLKPLTNSLAKQLARVSRANKILLVNGLPTPTPCFDEATEALNALEMEIDLIREYIKQSARKQCDIKSEDFSNLK